MLLPDAFLDSYLQQIRTGDRTRRPEPLQPLLCIAPGDNRDRRPRIRHPLIAAPLVDLSPASESRRSIAGDRHLAALAGFLAGDLTLGEDLLQI